MLATDRAAYAEMPADTLKGITGISGLYDLEPTPPLPSQRIYLVDRSERRPEPPRAATAAHRPARGSPYTWRLRKRRIKPPSFDVGRGAR